MKCKLTFVCLGLGALVTSRLFGEEGIKHPVEVTTTERFAFAPGGIIRVNGAYGHLSVEGWDEPAVEITVTKSKEHDYGPEQQEHAKQLLERVRVVAERHSDTELDVSTILPRRGFFRRLVPPPFPRTTEHGVQVDYDIHVPRDSRLVIRHRGGYVMVSDVLGGIEATNRSGDMIVMLPDPRAYAIDAKSKVGPVSFDFADAAHRLYRLGERLAFGSPAPSRRVYLRVGIGSITIQEAPPGAEAPGAVRAK